MRSSQARTLAAALRVAGPLAAALLFSAAVPGASASGKCDGDSAIYRIMPKALGKPGQVSPAPYALPCDSMVVPSGQTTRIYGATMIHFGMAPASSGKITVKGDLIVEGQAGNPVYLSGSVTSTEFGFVPGPHSWGGLELDSGASLRMNHVRMFNAPTALVLFSQNVILEDSYFRGVSGVVLPDTSLFLDPQGQTIAKLDLRSGKAVGMSGGAESGQNPGSSHPSGSGGRSGKRTAIVAAGGVGIAAILLGAGWLALNATGEDPKKDQEQVTDPDGKFENLPTLPGIPPPASR